VALPVNHYRSLSIDFHPGLPLLLSIQCLLVLTQTERSVQVLYFSTSLFSVKKSMTVKSTAAGNWYPAVLQTRDVHDKNPLNCVLI